MNNADIVITVTKLGQDYLEQKLESDYENDSMEQFLELLEYDYMIIKKDSDIDDWVKEINQYHNQEFLGCIFNDYNESNIVSKKLFLEALEQKFITFEIVQWG